MAIIKTKYMKKLILFISIILFLSKAEAQIYKQTVTSESIVFTNYQPQVDSLNNSINKLSAKNKALLGDVSVFTAKNKALTDSIYLLKSQPAKIIYFANYYVDPKGNDINPGSFDKPFLKLSKAVSVAKPGDLIYVRGGVYTKVNSLNAGEFIEGKNGLAYGRIIISNYPGETPVFAYNLTGTSNHYGVSFRNCSYIDIIGIEVTGIKLYSTDYKYNCFGINFSNCNYINILNCISHDNQGPGISVNGNSSNNYIVNCDSYNNWDKRPVLNGENADGIQLYGIPKGNKNYIIGCRMWNNSDDALDLFYNDGIVIIDNCWAWHNGYQLETNIIAGNGNGFKLGKTTATYLDTLRVVTNCISAYNRKIGFQQNAALCNMVISNNISLSNGSCNYQFTNGTSLSFTNNISLYGGVKDYFSTNVIQANNSWQSGNTLITKSIDVSKLAQPRKSDGSLPDL